MREIHVCAFRGRIHSVTGVKRPSASVPFHGVLFLPGRCSREGSAERPFPPRQDVSPRMWSERDAYSARGVPFPRQRMDAEYFDSVQIADMEHPFEVVVRSLTQHLRFPRSASVFVDGIIGSEKRNRAVDFRAHISRSIRRSTGRRIPADSCVDKLNSVGFQGIPKNFERSVFTSGESVAGTEQAVSWFRKRFLQKNWICADSFFFRQGFQSFSVFS